ncbi:MAG TPA: hypothetical protein VK466_16305, partial [Terriglobales bacterium]|nr:hypothetical protein [Terriglobales bacterium]
MSLTSFVELPDVKERLRMDVAKPWFQLRAEIKAPLLTASYGWTGTAFDYLLRFYVEKLNPSARKSAWIAEESLAILEDLREKPSTLKRARRIVETARERYHSYLRAKGEEKPGEELIRAAIDLAQLDPLCRIGRLDLQPTTGAMLYDLGNLLTLVRP